MEKTGLINNSEARIGKMTPEERKELVYKAVDAQTAGDKAELNRLMKLIPLAPTMAKAIKMSLGLDFLLNAGYDLSEVEEAFGKEWLEK